MQTTQNLLPYFSYMKFLSSFFAASIVLFASLGAPVLAQEIHNDYQGTWRAKVVEVIDERTEDFLGTEMLVQTLEVKLLEGPQEETTVIFDSDYLELDKGDKVFVNHLIDINGTERYQVINTDRRGALIILVLIFVAAVILLGRWQGVRSIVALLVSFLVIIFVLLPGLLHGWNPLIASFLVAGGILFAAIFFTHGFNRESAVAYGGTMIAVLLTALFAIFAVHITDLSGFATEETTYLNFGTGGTLNFTALLLGAYIIGFLGVLDDIAVTQAAVVTELFDSNPEMSKKEVYHRAMRVGREHVGALVNTLVLAYTGASLPLLLYFHLGSVNFGSTINLEIFATEIVRIKIGRAHV